MHYNCFLCHAHLVLTSAGDDITVQNGRYGPYLKAGADSRTLPTEEHLFTMTLRRSFRVFIPSQRNVAAELQSHQ
jgi:DNA topoisomerase I